MSDRRTTATRRTRMSWAVFWTVSAVALAVCFVAVLDAGGMGRALVALVGGLVVVALAALLTDWCVSGLAEPGDGGGRSYVVAGDAMAGGGSTVGGSDGGGAGCGHGGGHGGAC